MSREQSRSHHAPGTEFHIGKIEIVANTGTYLDSPFHRYADVKDVPGLANCHIVSGVFSPVNAKQLQRGFLAGGEVPFTRKSYAQAG